MNDNKAEKGIRIFVKFLFFFCMNAFVITCCFLLFLYNLDLPKEQITGNAKITFNNVVILSLVFLLIDFFMEKWLVDRPIKMINDGLNRIMKGEFDTKIDELKSIENNNQLNSIIRQVNKMAKELEGVETLKSDFISNVSHEIKTPLAIIGNYAQLLECDDISDEIRKEYTLAIKKSTQRLSELITNILKLNKLENQQIYQEMKQYNLSDQLCECLIQFENIWEEKNIHIAIDIKEDVYIIADSELLSIVWNNLISNALKFTDVGGMVFVGLRVEDNAVIVSVKDSGCGISKETGKHIFDKFYQGDTSHASIGNGLGLALVKKVIDIMNGEISVHSEVGKGSLFEVRLNKER